LDSFEPTGADLAKIYAALQRIDSKSVTAKLDAAGIEPLVASIRAQYEERSYEVFADHHLALAAWLVASVGPAIRDAIPFELSLRHEVIVAPRWVLAQPIRSAQHRRCPALPLVWPSAWERDDSDGWLRLAYEGLLDHLNEQSSDAAGAELSTSAIQWRLVALVDALAPERSDREHGQSVAARLNELLSRTLQLTVNTIEENWIKSIDTTLAWRRHALTHLLCEPSDGSARWTFKRCVEPALPMSDLLPMCAGLSLAVMDRVADALRNEPDGYIRRLADRCERDLN
jgi:hypothetical protein